MRKTSDFLAGGRKQIQAVIANEDITQEQKRQAIIDIHRTMVAVTKVAITYSPKLKTKHVE